MKKLILILVALVGLVGSVSAEIVHLYDATFLVSNKQIGTLEYNCGSINRFSDVYKTLTQKYHKKCVYFIKDNKDLNAEVKTLTEHFGISQTILPNGEVIVNTYDGENFSFYQFQ